jgi:hypothetical protein
MEQISLFDKSSASGQLEELSIRNFLKRIKTGYWKKYQDKVRKAKGDKDRKNIKRFQTPCVTICGVFSHKRVGIPDKPSGFIGIDVDGKDNKGLMDKREQLEADPYIFACFTSIGGEGLCLIFKIKQKKHRELFNGIQAYLYEEYDIVVDPLVKDPARLRYVSYDKECFYDFKKKPFTQAIVSVPTPALGKEEHSDEDIEDLVAAVEKSGIDIAPRYHEWYIMGQALAQLGEKGRKAFHRLSKLNEDYSKDECDAQFDNCLNQEAKGMRDQKVGLGSIFFFAKEAGITVSSSGPTIKSHKKTKIIEKHNNSVMLSLSGHKLDKGIYTYHIWAFKIIFKKDEKTDVECLGINPEATSDFLFNRGIRRSGKTFYRLTGNIVEVISWDSILDMVVQEGVKLPKDFSITWDEDSEVVIRKNILNKVQGGGRKVMERDVILKEFVPENEEFITDTETDCFLFFKNGVVQINSKAGKKRNDGQHQLIPWEDIQDFKDYSNKFVWKEQIIDRDFKYVKKKSLIQTILENAIGKDHWNEITSSIGYMIHTFIYGEGVEILFCIDRNVGDINEGGNGKDFFRQIIGNVRKTTVVPGKSLNIGHQFSWERVDQDTQIVWIEDLGKHIKMEQLYNLNNGINVRRMHTQPFTVKSKIGISLQHLINMEGSSDQRRQIFLMFTDYYSQRGGIGKVHNDRNIFGDSWQGWDEYYSMIVDCVMYYLKHGVRRMDITHLLEMRKNELSDGSFEGLEQGTWYTTEGAIELCWGKDVVINTETFISFRKKLSQWAKLSGLTIEAERKSIAGKQQKAIRVCAPMKISTNKVKRK